MVCRLSGSMKCVGGDCGEVHGASGNSWWSAPEAVR